MEDKKLKTALDNWIKLQPLSESNRNRLSRKFTIDKENGDCQLTISVFLLDYFF